MVRDKVGPVAAFKIAIIVKDYKNKIWENIKRNC